MVWQGVIAFEDLTFSSYPWRLFKILFTPEDVQEENGSTPKENGSTPQECREIKASLFTPQRIPYFFYSTPKEILNFYNLSRKNSISGQ